MSRNGSILNPETIFRSQKEVCVCARVCVCVPVCVSCRGRWLIYCARVKIDNNCAAGGTNIFPNVLFLHALYRHTEIRLEAQTSIHAFFKNIYDVSKPEANFSVMIF